MFNAIASFSQRFGSKTLINSNHAHWLEDTFDWCKTHFYSEALSHPQLVQPSNAFFPGRVSSVEEKAQLILEQTQQYCGLAHWPCQLQTPNQAHFAPMPTQLDPAQLVRQKTDDSNEVDKSSPKTPNTALAYTDYRPQQALSLPVFYLADQTLKPTDLAASYAFQLAQHLIQQKQIIPPGGVELINEAAEVLAIFMGFGVLLVNSAHTFRGGCGSCYNAQANRAAQLSENQALYALALFAKEQQLDNKTVLSHVKKHLHSNYKTALRQLQQTR